MTLQFDLANPLTAERQIARRFAGTPEHPCAVCRDQARAGSREPGTVAPGTERRLVGGLVVVVCWEHRGVEL